MYDVSYNDNTYKVKGGSMNTQNQSTTEDQLEETTVTQDQKDEIDQAVNDDVGSKGGYAAEEEADTDLDETSGVSDLENDDDAGTVI